MTYEQIVLITYIVYVIFMTIITIITYKIDKEKALSSKERIKEKTLLALAVFGGGLGAFLGRIISRHKTNKLYFSLVIYLALILQIACLAILMYLAIK